MSELTTITPMALVHQLMQRPDFTTDMLRDMLDMVKEQEHRIALQRFREAFARCQAAVTKAEKDKPNPLFNSRYATLEAMYDAVWPAVMEEGFAWTVSALTAAPTGWDDNVMWWQGRLSMGIITETVELPVPRTALSAEGPRGGRAAMTPMQQVGALTTYMRKYLLGLMFGVVTGEDVKVDNDGNGHLAAPPSRSVSRETSPLKRQTLREWMAEFEANCNAAQTPEAASKVLDPADKLMGDFLSSRPEAKAQYDTIRAACIARLWPEMTEDELPEVRIIGEENLAG